MIYDLAPGSRTVLSRTLVTFLVGIAALSSPACTTGADDGSLTGVASPSEHRASSMSRGGERLVWICHRDRSGSQTVIRIAQPATSAHLRHGDSFAPCVPKLLSPPEGALLPQNNASAECLMHPTRGSGIRITFDWADPRDPRGRIAGYIVFAKSRNAVLPIIDNVFTPESQFTYVRCNAFVVDANLSGWEWKVRTVGTDGTLGEFSEVRTWTYEPCRLEDGSPCSAPVP